MDEDPSPKGCIRWMVVVRRGMCRWLKPRPCRWSFHSSNPMCYGSLGARGFDPLPPEALLWGTVVSNGCPLCGTSVEDSFNLHRLLCNSRGLVRGAYDTVSVLGHVLLQISLDGQASGGQRARKTTQAPLHSRPGCPWTRSGPYLAITNRRMHPARNASERMRVRPSLAFRTGVDFAES